MLKSGGIVIDTPGMRELGLWDFEEGIERVFADIEEFAASCALRNLHPPVRTGLRCAGSCGCGRTRTGALGEFP